jgi:signal transduction histidine kinase
VGAPADSTQRLARTLRTAATWAAETVGGGQSLVFAVGEPVPHDVRLRAASGFSNPEEARSAGTVLVKHVRTAIAQATACEVPADALPANPRTAGGIWIHPVRVGEQILGALALASPAKPSDAQSRNVAEIVGVISLALDHARLDAEFEALRSGLEKDGFEDSETSEEVLRLSEALFAQDIELLRSTEKLGKIERLKNDFIEKMSRELRTPLNSIIEAIISVLTGEDDALSESAKSALRSALDEGSAFLRTLQNILDLWRIKQGELPVECQDVNFRELADEAIFSVQDSIGDRNLRIETDIIEPFPRLRTDLAKLNQILFLLLDNAVKFTPEGTITIRAQVDEGVLHVSVVDNGIGICHDDQQFIFDEFYQVDEPSSQKYRGAGLGLTLVRDLVVLVEGEISVKSDIGRGTTVSLTIPLQQA